MSIGPTLETHRLCPSASVTRAEMASFLVRALELPPTGLDRFTDDEGHWAENDINRLFAAGVTGGCTATRYCPSANVTRAQMASFLVRGFDFSSAVRDYFADDDVSVHQTDINRLAESAITGGCGGIRFCPGAAVTRGQMAAFLHRALTWDGGLPACSLFPATNVWNKRVDGLPVAANSATLINTIGAGEDLHPDFGEYLGYGIPMNMVNASTPQRSVSLRLCTTNPTPARTRSRRRRDRGRLGPPPPDVGHRGLPACTSCSPRERTASGWPPDRARSGT